MIRETVQHSSEKLQSYYREADIARSLKRPALWKRRLAKRLHEWAEQLEPKDETVYGLEQAV